MKFELRRWWRQGKVEWSTASGAVHVDILRVRAGLRKFIPVLCVVGNICTMVASKILKRSTWPFVCCQCTEVKVFAIPRVRERFVCNLFENCGPLSVSTYLGAPYLKTQWEEKDFDTSRSVVRFRVTNLVSFLKRSVITSMNRFPYFAFGNEQKRSTVTNSSGCFAGVNSSAASGG